MNTLRRLRAVKVRDCLVLISAVLLSGCASIVGSLTSGLATNLSTAILDSDDPAMIRDGAPAYLILIDSLLAGSPDSPQLLAQSAELHSAYAGAFVDEPERARQLHSKAKTQMLYATCLSLKDACGLERRPFQEFSAWVEAQGPKSVPTLYNLGSIWAGWIQANSADFGAVGQLGRAKALIQRVAELEPEYANGGAFLYLGVFETLLPPAMGGRPELGKQHFERALQISDERNLMVKVMLADQYGRLMFDRELHDGLLQEVMAADVQAPGLTLMNTVAKERAQQLLDSGDDYF